MMNDVRRLALRHGHVERREDEFGAEMRFHRPADDPATPGVVAMNCVDLRAQHHVRASVQREGPLAPPPAHVIHVQAVMEQ
jgi:hypothetical protein